jgi:deoxycytidine triphosphate deaminase
MISKKRMVEKMAAGKLHIEPLNRSNLSEVGIDLTIGEVHQLACPENRAIDMKKPHKYEKVTLGSKGYILRAGEVYLIGTTEHINTNQTCGLISPVQNMVRTGMHMTTGMVDYGYSGAIYITVSVEKDTKIYPGMTIAKFSLFDSTISIKERYAGHFQNSQINMKEIKDAGSN